MSTTATRTIDNSELYVYKTQEWNWEIDHKGGSCYFEIQDGNIGIISHLYVPPKRRNQGIGSAIIEKAIDVITDHEVNEIHAQIKKSNQEFEGATEHLLQKFGFETLELEKSHFTLIDGVKRLNENDNT